METGQPYNTVDHSAAQHSIAQRKAVENSTEQIRVLQCGEAEHKAIQFRSV